jgi:hypothetical protein
MNVNGDDPRPEATSFSSRLTWVCAALHVPAWALLFLSLLFLVPRFEAVFADFGIDLPAMTTSAIRASHLLARSGVLVVPAVVGVVLTLDFLALGWGGSSRGTLGWSVFGLLVPLGLFGATIAALLVPLIGLQSRLVG